MNGRTAKTKRRARAAARPLAGLTTTLLVHEPPGTAEARHAQSLVRLERDHRGNMPRRNIPKAERVRTIWRRPGALTDPLHVLGHPARPRTRSPR